MVEKIEIDEAHYCAGDFYSEGCFRWDEEDPDGGCKCTLDKCKLYHRKWPTPEQYKAEYCEEWPDDRAVYTVIQRGVWFPMSHKSAKVEPVNPIVCACTTWGKPPDEWRPE
jgi:hypothetical protein